MEYSEAVALIRKNPYNLSLIPVELIDLKLVRFVRKLNVWAVVAYAPKHINKIWLHVVLDHTIKFTFIDIDNDGWKCEYEDYKV
jgi:hypothetical protein